MTSIFRRSAAAGLSLAVFCVAAAQGHAPAKKPLDHEAYDIWKAIKDREISDDGQWVQYSLASEDGDPELHVRHTRSDRAFKVEQGTGGAFEDDARHVVFLIKPKKADVRQAKLNEKKKEEQPKDDLGILDLGTGGVVRVERVKSFKLPKKAPGFVAYQMEKPLPDKDSKRDDKEKAESKAEKTTKEKAGEKAKEKSAAEIAADKKKKKRKDKKEEGTPLVLRSLDTGTETRFENALEYLFSDNGRWFVYTASDKEGKADGIFAVETASGKVTTLLKSKGAYLQAVFDETGAQLAFLSNHDDVEAEQPRFTLCHWRTGTAAPVTLVSEDTKGIRAGWWVSENGNLSFSKKGRRLFFGTAPRPAPDPDETLPDDEKVTLDVWNWKDPLLQPMQLKRLETEKKRNYCAVVHLADKRIVQLADEALPEVTVGTEGEADVALANNELPYRQRISWDSDYSDVYVVDVDTGERRQVLKELHGTASLSPQARYLSWWNDDEMAWYALPVRGGRPVNLTVKIPYPLQNEKHDTPGKPIPYGVGGWTDGDASLLVYDKHDIWAVDPTGTVGPRCVTEGAARAGSYDLRCVNLDPEVKSIDPAAPMLLAAFNLDTKAGGFYRDRVNGSEKPRSLIMMNRFFAKPQMAKAEDSDELLFTRQSFQEFPDLWVSGPDFADSRRVSRVNPQQAEYLWGSAELVNWSSLDGTPLTGILYKPENFDPSRTYPMIVSIYERNSARLNYHLAPGTSKASPSTSINYSFYVSRGYLVFLPDIPFRSGYPGESALCAVVPGVNALVAKGFVDQAHIGVQGHSWGGYEVAYLIARTNIFAAAQAGAPVSNMVSAYGGIRWGTGESRMFQYEKGQSRIGGTLWEFPLRFIENSPIFHANRIETPLLILHNDQDGAVPWYQGIELFAAGRRLGKPMWMLNYSGEGHDLAKYRNKKDLAIRMQQFFDHYLKGSPAPVWMERGVPAIRKGKDSGLGTTNAEDQR